MVNRQQAAIEQFRYYLEQNGVRVIKEQSINHGIQFQVAKDQNSCIVNFFTTGQITVQGKENQLRQQLEGWKTSYSKEATVTLSDSAAVQNHATAFSVALAKIEVVREYIAAEFNRINWYEGDSSSNFFYRAEILSRSEKVVLTQFRTGKLLVQGRSSELFERVCEHLDRKLSQPIEERATRYIPESTREAALEVMIRGNMSNKALKWINEEIGQEAYAFFYPHDQETLLSAAMLLFAVEEDNIRLPDYSVLVMPFGRAYEGFLLKLFIYLGFADEAQIRQSADSIRIGNWLNDLREQIVDTHRHGHLSDDLRTAWTGSRNLIMHSDPVRDVKITTIEVVQREIGVILRAIQRGHDELIVSTIELKKPGDKGKSVSSVTTEISEGKKDIRKLENIDEALLLKKLNESGYEVESIENPEAYNKWQVNGNDWKIFLPRSPGNELIVKGKNPDVFCEWYHKNITQAESAPASFQSMSLGMLTAPTEPSDNGDD